MKYSAMKYLTAAERAAIEAENAANHWGYDYDAMKKFMRQAEEGSAKVRASVIYRFEDVNYHDLANALEMDDFASAKGIVEKYWKEI